MKTSGWRKKGILMFRIYASLGPVPEFITGSEYLIDTGVDKSMKTSFKNCITLTITAFTIPPCLCSFPLVANRIYEYIMQ